MWKALVLYPEYTGATQCKLKLEIMIPPLQQEIDVTFSAVCHFFCVEWCGDIQH
jgi:hypothetical protein